MEILGGLSLENFADESPANQKAIQIQKKLYNSRYTAGVQIRVGHDFTNKANIETLRQRVLDLGIPYVIHGAAENLGVDLGEHYDERDIFFQYKQQNQEKSWKDFNLSALRNAGVMTRDNPHLLNKRIIIHPGYAPWNRIKEGEIRAADRLRKLKSLDFSLETVPETAILGEDSCFGMGSNLGSMKNLLKSRTELDVLIDFTHVLVSANQEQLSNPDYFSEIIPCFLELPVSNITHFSGLTYKLRDEHAGFLDDNEATGDNKRIGIIKEALAELERRHLTKQKKVYVALEMRFRDIESTKRQIEAFREDYC